VTSVDPATTMKMVSTQPLLAAQISMPQAERSCLTAFQSEFDYLCRTLRRLGIRSSDLEDVVHEVFLVLHRRWDDYDPSFPLRPWLFGIAFRVAAAHRKRTAREVPLARVEVEDTRPHPEQAAVTEEARATVLAALEQVPLRRRAVLVMHDLDNLGMRDIASGLSIPLFTAYSRLRKARKEFEAAVRRSQKRGPKP
jgi:RNA polymerase sigma-70 factor (ECF subfamily)